MSLKNQFGVNEYTKGRGGNRSIILIGINKEWLTRVRYSADSKLWLVSKGGPVALGKIIASSHDFDTAREMAHKMALLREEIPGEAFVRTKPTPQEHDTLDDEDLARIVEIMADAESSSSLNDWESEFCDSIRDRITEFGNKARISDRQWDVIDRIGSKLYGA